MAPERRAAALVRLRRYAGQSAGHDAPHRPRRASACARSWPTPPSLGPSRAEVEKNLGNSGVLPGRDREAVPEVPDRGLRGPAGQAQAAGRRLRRLRARSAILPRARTDFRLPPELYAFSPQASTAWTCRPEALADRARMAFMEIRNEMRALAPLVAKEKGLAVTDYRDGPARAEEGPARRGGHPSPLPGSGWPTWRRSSGASAWSRLPTRPAQHPAGQRGGERRPSRAQHAAAAPDRQHGRDAASSCCPCACPPPAPPARR